MNEFFNYNRFRNVFNFDLKNNVANFGLSVLLLSLGAVICYMVVAFMSFLYCHFTWEGGPVLAARIACFAVVSVFFFIMFPSKAYGYVTEKRMGSAYVMLPASSTEKFISMAFNVLILFPAFYLIVYLGTDYLICLADTSCGRPLISAVADMFTNMDMDTDGVLNVSIFRCILSMFEILLAFLLGALYFKKRKISGVILIYLVLGILSSTIMFSYFGTHGELFQSFDQRQTFINFASAYMWISKVLQILVCIGLLVWVFFRVKTLKH